MDSYFLWAVRLVLFTRHAQAYWAKKLPKLLAGACHLQDSGVLEIEGSGWRAFLGELPWKLRGQEMSLDGSFEGEQHKEGEDCCIKKAINGKHWEKVLMMLKKGQN